MDEIKQLLKEIDKKQDEHSAQMASVVTSLNYHKDTIANHTEEIKEINTRLIEYNGLLEVHIAGVKELKQANELMKASIDQRDKEFAKNSELKEKEMMARIELAERPYKWITNTVKIILGISAGIATIMGFVEFIEWIKKIK